MSLAFALRQYPRCPCRIRSQRDFAVRPAAGPTRRISTRWRLVIPALSLSKSCYHQSVLRVAKQSSRFRNWYCRRFHRLGGPWQDEQGSYQRCLDCGRRIPWSEPALPLSGLSGGASGSHTQCSTQLNLPAESDEHRAFQSFFGSIVKSADLGNVVSR